LAPIAWLCQALDLAGTHFPIGSGDRIGCDRGGPGAAVSLDQVLESAWLNGHETVEAPTSQGVSGSPANEVLFIVVGPPFVEPHRTVKARMPAGTEAQAHNPLMLRA
jgi:hypothetical protein